MVEPPVIIKPEDLNCLECNSSSIKLLYELLIVGETSPPIEDGMVGIRMLR